MKFSLIVTTQGNRMEEFVRLLDSLSIQTYDNFELIVIDQSRGDEVKKVCNDVNFQKSIISTSDVVSLSHARNLGLRLIEGDIVAFPDDDCWYPQQLLEQVKKCFESKLSIDCVCCCGYDPEKKRTLSKRAPKQGIVRINTINALKYPMSIGIFAKTACKIYFDENLGVGTKWGSGEESDYILQLLYNNRSVIYYSNILVYHPYHNEVSNEQAEKNYQYGLGYGALIKKAINRGQFGVLLDYYTVIFRSIGGYLFYKVQRNMLCKNYIMRIKGIIHGRKFA